MMYSVSFNLKQLLNIFKREEKVTFLTFIFKKVNDSEAT